MGYEIYLRDPSRGGDLWDRVFEAGKEFNIRPVAPVEARRIEAGIFNYGSDMTIANNPFEVMGLERLVEPQEADYIGKAALEEIRVKGVTRKLVGIEAPGDRAALRARREAAGAPPRRAGRHGDRPDLVAAPGAEHRLRLAADRALRPGTELEIVAPDGDLWAARSAAIPFLDAEEAGARWGSSARARDPAAADSVPPRLGRLLDAPERRQAASGRPLRCWSLRRSAHGRGRAVPDYLERAGRSGNGEPLCQTRVAALIQRSPAIASPIHASREFGRPWR